MPSSKKLQVYRRGDFHGPRRAKPPVRALNQQVRAQVQTDHEVVQAIIRDADIRRALIRGMDLDPNTHSVWNDFDHSSTITELAPSHLPTWENIGEYAKLQLLYQVALEYGGYTFTARIRPDLQGIWEAAQRNPMDRVRRATTKQLAVQGLDGLEYCWIMEGRSRHGGGRTPLHLHGFLIASDPRTASRFKVALEQSVSVHPKGKLAAGYARRSGDAVRVERAYDVRDGSDRGHGRWATYMSKNALRGDTRVGSKRTFMSQTATQTIRELWALIREE